MSANVSHWYYLHQNGELIHKQGGPEMAADFRESDLVVAFWLLRPADRESAWNLLIEAAAAGAKPKRIAVLAELWNCTDDDAHHYANRVGCNLFTDGNKWCATDAHFEDLMQSPAGFGDTCLEAMAELAKELSYRPQKMWGATFPDLLRKRENSQFGVGA